MAGTISRWGYGAAPALLGVIAVLTLATASRAVGVPACTPPVAPLPDPVPSSPSVQVCLDGDNALEFCELPVDCPNGTCIAPTRVGNRYLMFQTPSSWAGRQIALRVTLLSLDGFSSFNGQTRWIGTPQNFPEHDAIEYDSAEYDRMFRAAHLVCAPVYREWTTTELLHAYGTEIIPHSLYTLQAIEQGCDDANENDYSHPLLLLTHRWGDVAASFEDGNGPAGPQPDLADISTVVDKFLGYLDYSATGTKAMIQLAPNEPDPSRPLTIRDVDDAILSFIGADYSAKYTGPDSCPHRVPACGDGILDPGEECDDGDVAPGDGCDANCRGEDATLELRIIPVNPPPETGVVYSPDVAISGNAFVLESGGHRLWFELQISGFGGTLTSWQLDLVEPLSSGFGPVLEYPILQCTSGDFCESILGIGSGCIFQTDPRVCEYGYQDGANTRFPSNLTIQQVRQDTLTFAGVPLFFDQPINDDGGVYYAGSLVVDVPVDAAGTYPIEFDSDRRTTILLDGSDPVKQPIPIAALEPAVVRVAQGCCLGATCTTVQSTECSDLGGTPVLTCRGDCNNNGVADDCDVASGSSDDCNFDGIPDDCQPDEDCNTNAVRDICDIGAGTSEDCNFDLIPDECQPDEDCNTNSIKDLCEIGAGTELDCNGNLLPDSCDIAGGGSLDDNGDGVPDECCVSQTPLFVGPVKSRFLSLESVGTLGVRSAIRVTPQSLPDFEAFEGVPLWVGPPSEYPEEDVSQPGLMFTAAPLTCAPHYRDWSTIDLLHVFGGEIIPSAAYEVQLINEDCPNTFATNYSPALAATTGKWGDIEPPFQTPMGPPHPSFGDIAASVNKFLGAPGAPIKALAALVPNYVFPDRPIDFRGIAAVIEAFLGVPYSQANGITGPCTCPANVACGARPCALDNQCVNNGYCLDGFCTDACGRCRP